MTSDYFAKKSSNQDKLILYGTGPAVYVYSLTDGRLNVIRDEGREYLFATDTMLYEVVSRTQYRLYDLNGMLISEGAIDPPGFTDKEYYSKYIGCADGKLLFVFTTYSQQDLFSTGSSAHNCIVAFDAEAHRWMTMIDCGE